MSDRMSDLVKSLRETVLLVPMKNGGEMVTGLGEFAADRIEAQGAAYEDLQSLCDKLTAENAQLEAALQAIYSRIEPGKHNPVKGGAKDVRAIALAALNKGAIK